MELLRYLRALEAKGAIWKTIRLSRKFLYDAVECTALAQTAEGVMRGVVEVRRQDDLSHCKAEITCYLGGQLDNNGEFKHAKHPKSKTTKIFEYEQKVFYRHKKIFGIDLGWTPESPLSAEHQYLVEMTQKLSAKLVEAQTAEMTQQAADQETVKRNAKEQAMRALFR